MLRILMHNSVFDQTCPNLYQYLDVNKSCCITHFCHTADCWVVFCRNSAEFILNSSNIHQRKLFPQKHFGRNGISMGWTEKRPHSTLFWYVRLTHQLDPSACHSRQYNEAVARLGSLKKHQQSNGPPGTARGSLIWPRGPA